MNILFFSLFEKPANEKKRNTYQPNNHQQISDDNSTFIFFLVTFFICLPPSTSVCLPFLCTYFFDKYFMWENFDAFLKHLIDKLWRMYDARKTATNKKRTKPFSWTWIPLARSVRAREYETTIMCCWFVALLLLMLTKVYSSVAVAVTNIHKFRTQK